VTPIIPDGCADIMTYNDQPPHVAGPDTITRLAPLSDGLTITGIRLKPGGVRAVFGCSAALIVNGEAPLAAISPGAVALHSALMTAGDIRSRHLLLSDWVRKVITHASASDLAVMAACQHLIAYPNFEIDVLAQQFDWNARTMRRHFIQGCGYGPKHFQRIMRVQRAIRAMQTADTRLANIAATAGYADQAHMSRDFRSITGFTPAGYAVTVSPGYSAWIEETF
jgi:AraC-like DNA-binding protein